MSRKPATPASPVVSDVTEFSGELAAQASVIPPTETAPVDSPPDSPTTLEERITRLERAFVHLCSEPQHLSANPDHLRDSLLKMLS